MYILFHDFDDPIYSFHHITDGMTPASLHFHRHYEISVVRSGKLNIIREGSNLRFDQPCIIMHAPYSFHAIAADSSVPYDHYVFHFSKESADELPHCVDVGLLFRQKLSVIPIDDSLSSRVYPILNAYDACSESDTTLKSLLMTCLLSIAQDNLASAIAKSPAVENRLLYIRDVTEYIDTHFYEKLSADSLAKKWFISRQKLDSDFKSLMSITLRQYLIDVRVANALRMLSMGQKVSETAQSCGFSCESHFNHIFKERVGYVPGRFAKICGFTSS